jgi:hypothetical protein
VKREEDPRGGAGRGTDDPQAVAFRIVVDEGRRLVANELDNAQRLEEKGRSQLTLAGTWFAFAQAAVGVNLIAGSHRPLAVIATALGILTALALLATFNLSADSWNPREYDDFDSGSLRGMAFEAHQKSELWMLMAISKAQTEHLEKLRDSNRKRADAMQTASLVWSITLALSVLEVAVAVFAHVLG